MPIATHSANLFYFFARDFWELLDFANILYEMGKRKKSVNSNVVNSLSWQFLKKENLKGFLLTLILNCLHPLSIAFLFCLYVLFTLFGLPWCCWKQWRNFQVQLKGPPLGTMTVEHTQVKGILEVNQDVEVYLDKVKEFVKATILQIKDCSQYTVGRYPWF